MLTSVVGYAQQSKSTKPKTSTKTISKTSTKSVKKPTTKSVSTKTSYQKMPIDSLLAILTNCKKLVVNHQTEFMHIDVPASKQPLFFNIILDSVATPSPLAKNLLYYNFETNQGNVFNGDIYFLPERAYIVFKLLDKTYYNAMTVEGMNQLKGYFKLK